MSRLAEIHLDRQEVSDLTDAVEAWRAELAHRNAISRRDPEIRPENLAYSDATITRLDKLQRKLKHMADDLDERART